MSWPLRILSAYFAVVSLQAYCVTCQADDDNFQSVTTHSTVIIASGKPEMPAIETTILPAISASASSTLSAMASTIMPTSAQFEPSTVVPTTTITPTPTITTNLISTIYPVLMTSYPTATVKLSDSYDNDSTMTTSDEYSLPALPHAGADSLTKGFSIPTFLPPFPVFAAADLPAFKAAAAAAAAKAASLATAPTSLTQESLSLHVSGSKQLPTTEGTPTQSTLNVSVQIGSHAYLPCQLYRLSNKPVSWIRMRDEHIISVDDVTFIADARFQPIYQESNDYSWSLQIKYVQHSDEGWYECQMAAEPKMSAKVYLRVIVPTTELIGDKNRFVKAGSKVALHCIVRGTLDPPKYIIWFYGKTKIPDLDKKTGWHTQIDRNIFGNIAENQNTIGSLTIPFVRKEDSGNYTCQPSNSVAVSLDLHVLSGEYSASAIMSIAQRQQYASTGLSTFSMLLILLLKSLQKT